MIVVSTSKECEATRGRINIGKIARSKTPAHEQGLPFCEGHFYWIGSDRGSTDLPEMNSTKGLVQSANGAEYESQGQARSEAERVAPGYQDHTRSRPERPK